ncbi:AIPR family protein [Chlorobaculum thiosulfatiphilum]|uniref:AIPR family protein n=2 Tax=Chlorobaculum thiosulfatiphilum TaxID=115852 RepID=A0A5C4S202_CHLTI|nr:AIPR family protein [Chlorobaculum thiosulfatiphilum]
MTTNDLVLLNQLLDQRMLEIGEGLDESEYFEIFSAEQALKDDDLSYDEIVSGIVDGGGDGGVDSAYFFINDSLYNEDIDISSLKRNTTLRLVLIQSKTTTGFSEESMNKLIASAKDLFDLNKEISELTSIYNRNLLQAVDHFRSVYLTLVSKFPTISFEYFSATKATSVHPNVERKVTDLKGTIERLFNPVFFKFLFLNTSALLASARRAPARTTTLRLAETPISTGQEGFACLVALKDFLPFITDEDGHIRAHLFEGNVRDYQGQTEVNKEIRNSLEMAGAEDFWWLNNGVSIICTNASLSGKTLTIEDAEIVNGLQTSREIYHTLHGKDLSSETRHIMLRVLKPQTEESRDRIIKATNSQTPIPAASLRATDKIHRDIEEYLYSKGYFYDRRKNYYKNIGKPIKKIVSIPFVAQAVMACALSDPANARARPSSLIKNNDTYIKVFSPSYPLDIFWKCPVIVQAVETELKRSETPEHRTHSNNLRFYVATLWTLRACGVPKPTIEQVAAVDLTQLSSTSIMNAVTDTFTAYRELGATDQVAKGTALGPKLREAHKQEFLSMQAAKKESNVRANVSISTNESTANGLI